MNLLPGLYPGEVVSYDPDARSCRVRIEGITDGSDTLPEAVFNNALGDNAATTETRILAGDTVWLMFEAGDPRFPIIMGYRTPRVANTSGWRRWQHANMQLIAEGTMLLTVGSTQVSVTDGLVAVTGADVTMDQDLTVTGRIVSHADITAAGNVADAGGAKTMSGMRDVFNAHRHPGTDEPTTQM
jgi:hypothetical protein